MIYADKEEPRITVLSFLLNIKYIDKIIKKYKHYKSACDLIVSL